MQGISGTSGRPTQGHAGHAFIERLVALAAAAGRVLLRWTMALAELQQQAKARRDLFNLSDRELKDIGVERKQIYELFR